MIGAGPSGLAAVRALQRRGIPVDGYEASHGVGGLWDITNPRSTMYESAHLISSRTTTEFREFPMRSRADYPGHREVLAYLRAYADEFALTGLYRFDTRVTRLEPRDGGWDLTAEDPDGASTRRYRGIVLANGTLAEPNVPVFPGTFDGEIRHTSGYSSADALRGKRVLIVGSGNSGCDIAVDAVHSAAAVDMSVRRGSYFVPRYLFGRPSDTISRGRPLPPRLKQAVDTRVLRLFTGDPSRFGFPRPDHRLYESHPIVNTRVLDHLGQGDLRIRPEVAAFDGERVRFRDGTADAYDLVLLATGYRLDYPFVDRVHLGGEGETPRLFLHMFPASFDGLFVIGMVEASGLGWQGRAEQAELLAAYLAAVDRHPERAARFRARVATRPWPDLTGGYRFVDLPRMAHYVDKHAYRRAVRREREALERHD